jgi:hypothetical protein
MLGLWTRLRDRGRSGTGWPLGRRLAQLMADRIIDLVVSALDESALLDRVDVDALLDRTDVDRLLDRVDANRLLARVDST